MSQWIEYSHVWLNGSGLQPYETLVPLGVDFDGGHYTAGGRYRGRLSGTSEQIENAVLSLSLFGVKSLTAEELLVIVENVQPTNSLQRSLPSETEQYLGPATLDAELRVNRALSETPF